MKRKPQHERQEHNSIMDYLYAAWHKEFTFLTFDRKGGYDPKSGGFRKIKRHGEDPTMSALDIVGWHHATSKILWLEVKVEKLRIGKRDGMIITRTKPTEGQYNFINHLIKTNTFYKVVYNIPTAQTAIQEFLAKIK